LACRILKFNSKIRFTALVLSVFLIIASAICVAAITWSDYEVRLTSYVDFDGIPAVVETNDRTLWIFWSRKTVDRYNLFYTTSTNEGASWSQETQLTVDHSADTGVSVCQASDGTIWVVWASDRTGNYDLYYKTSSDLGASWSGDVQLTSGPRIDSNPSVLQTIDEKVWVFWSQREPSETSTDDVYYLYSSDGGVSWSDVIQFTTDKYDDIWPSVVQTRRLRVWVVWTSDRADQPDWGNYDIYYRTSLVGDINENGVVDVIDLTLVSIAFGCFEGEPGYNPDADLNADGVVDMRDLSAVAVNLGTT